MEDAKNIQELLTDAMLYLYSRCDGAREVDNMGFQAGDARSKFLIAMREIAQQGRDMSYGQLTALWQVLKKYEDTQLKPAGYTLPEFADIKKFIETTGRAPKLDVSLLHVEDGKFIYVHTAFKLKDKMGDLRTDFYNHVSDYGSKYCGQFKRGTELAKAQWLREHKIGDVTGFWRFPASPATLKLIFSYFEPQKVIGLTKEAQQYHNDIVEAELNAKIAKIQEIEARRREVNDLLAVIGGVDFTFGAGKTLFPHQKVGVQFALERRRCINNDETGLGKTYEGIVPALALQKKYGWNVYIITTLSSMDSWHDVAEELGCKHEIFSWDYRKIPKADNERPHEKFILIVDEAHYAASMTSQRTKKLLELAWHHNCEACFLLTGTPLTNGRPVNMYPLLLAVRSPLVYPDDWCIRNYPIRWNAKDDNGEGTRLPGVFYKMKRDYEQRYCGGEYKQVSRNRSIWDVSGSTNLREFYLKTQYRDDKENFETVCCISRRKKDCVKLPPKMRIMLPVEVSDEGKRQFAETVVQKWREFELHTEEEIEKFKAKIQEEEGRDPDKAEIKDKHNEIIGARALVEYNIFRQAGAWAKMETALVQSLEIVERGNKLVIFTGYTDIAKTLGKRINDATGKKVSYITGDTKDTDRFAAMKDFQDPNGETQVIVSTRAGGESITLTESQYMIIIDRPLTPGLVKQWEDRIHRLTTKGTVTIYWLQLPVSLCPIDFTIDGVIQSKQINIDAAQYGEDSSGLEFVSEKQLTRQALDIVSGTAKRYSKTYGKAA